MDSKKLPDDDAPSGGFLASAQGLLNRVIERGLHLPQAAEEDEDDPSSDDEEIPVPTLFLANLYANQGLRTKALETVRAVLAVSPDNLAAQQLAERLEREIAEEPPVEASAPTVAEEDVEDGFDAAGKVYPSQDVLVAAAPGPDEDVCVALDRGEGSLFVFWHLSKRFRAFVEQRSGDAPLVLRRVVYEPGLGLPRKTVFDELVPEPVGHRIFRIPPGAVVRVAVGKATETGWMPLAHSPALEAEEGAPDALAPERLLRRTARGAERLSSDDPDAGIIAYACELARASTEGKSVTRVSQS